ncbi:MAG: hypothetical protein HC813_03605 [Planctomycetes bacterium]|nr:hypothetical protein [Planctomycetota bacterium]
MDNPGVKSNLLLALALFAAALRGAQAKEDPWPDMMHPRAPQTPLEIVFKPWHCPTCIAEGLLPPLEKPRTIEMMRQPIEQLAKQLDLEPGYTVIETPHFRILSDLGKGSVKWKDGTYNRADVERLKEIFPKLVIGRDGSSLDRHERAHLYHIRVERIYSHMAELLDCKEPWLGMHAPYELYLFADFNEHHAFNDRYIGRANDKAGVQDHKKDAPNFMLFTTAESQVAAVNGKGDRVFSNHVIHNVAHNLADGFGNYYRETWAWLEEGIAHYYERRENPRFNTFCWAEGKKPADFLKPDWESSIYNLVRRGKDTPFPQWCEKLLPGELSGVEQGLCWSMVQYMVETEPIRFTKMWQKLNDYKEKPDASTCIEHAFGVPPSVLHTRWREWALEAYAKR